MAADTKAAVLMLPPIILPTAVIKPPVLKLDPVILPTAEAVEPTTKALLTAKVPLAPSACATTKVVPLTLACMFKLPPEIALLILASVVVVLTLNTLATPTLSPVLFKMLTVPVVVVLAVARMKSVESRLSNNCALVADPANTALDTVLDSVNPGKMVGNAVTKDACGVNDTLL